MKKHWILAAACLSGLAFSVPATAQVVERTISADDNAPAASTDIDSAAARRPSTSTSGGSTSVPEPGMLGLFGLGLVAVGYARYRRRARA